MKQQKGRMLLPQWRVHVQGAQLDLKELQKILADYDPSIIHDGSNFYLTSKEWNQLNDAREVKNRAKDFIQLLENAHYLHSRQLTALSIGGVVRIDDDGVIHHIVIPATGALTASLQRVNLQATDNVGEKQLGEVTQEHQLKRFLRAATENSNVKDALNFYRKGDWYSLYKTHEIVEDQVGGKRMRNWVSRKSLERFTQMAQSREGLGDDARHASEQYKPPAKPVSLDEAKNIIGKLLQSWIDSL